MTAPGKIEIQEFPLTPPQPGWAVLRILRSGVCGTDLHTFRGELLQYAGTPHERRLEYPLICGHENVGVVEAVAGIVLDYEGNPVEPGDRLVPGANVACGECSYCRGSFPYYACERLQDYGNSLNAADPPHLLGGWSEYLYVMPGSPLFRVPDGVSDGLAALTELFSVTHALDRPELSLSGATVYVLGCGPLGICHVAKARLRGAEQIIAVDRFPLRLRLAQQVGATDVLPLDRTSADERIELVRSKTGGRGVDVAIEAAGAPEAFREGLASLRFGGTLLEVGAFTGSRPTQIDVAADICLRDTRIIGVGGEDDAAYPGTLELMAEHADDLGLESIVTHVLPLNRAVDALRLAGRGDAVKVQITPHQKG